MRLLTEIPRALINPPSNPMRFEMDDDALADLADDMRRQGQLQNLVVFPLPPFEEQRTQEHFAQAVRVFIEQRGRFEITAGHRRYVASGLAGIGELDCLVLPDRGKANLAAMCSENAKREGINPADEAIKFFELVKETDCTEAELCAITGHKVSYIYARLDLIKGFEDVFAAVQQHGLALSVAKELNKCPREDHRRRFIEMVIDNGATAATVRGWVSDTARLNLPMPAPGVAASDLPAAYVEPATIYKCILCEGTTDPYNMVPVWIHKWELEAFRKFLRAAHAAKSGVQLPIDN